MFDNHQLRNGILFTITTMKTFVTDETAKKPEPEVATMDIVETCLANLERI